MGKWSARETARSWQLHRNSKVMIAGIAILLLAIATMASFLLVGGSGFDSCKRIIITQNRYDCITQLAESTSNSSMCAYLSGAYSGQCYYAIATQTGRQGLCAYAMNSSQTSGDACFYYFANSTDNASLCRDVNYSLQYKCASAIAYRLGDSAACDMAGNNTEISACMLAIGTYDAASSGNYTYCSTLTGNETLLQADAQASALSTARGASPVEYSNLLIAASNKTYPMSDFCYAMIGISTGNSAYCSRINNQTIEYACNSSSETFTQQNINLTDRLAGCDSALGGNQSICRDAVMLAYAVQDNNATVCGRLNSSMQIECYQSLAQTYSNSTYCSYIANVNSSIAQEASQSCVYGVRGQSGN